MFSIWGASIQPFWCQWLLPWFDFFVTFIWNGFVNKTTVKKYLTDIRWKTYENCCENQGKGAQKHVVKHGQEADLLKIFHLLSIEPNMTRLFSIAHDSIDSSQAEKKLILELAPNHNVIPFLKIIVQIKTFFIGWICWFQVDFTFFSYYMSNM